MREGGGFGNAIVEDQRPPADAGELEELQLKVAAALKLGRITLLTWKVMQEP
jgi:hypothetical protein